MMLIMRHSPQPSNYLAVLEKYQLQKLHKTCASDENIFLLDNLSQNYPPTGYVITEFFVTFRSELTIKFELRSPRNKISTLSPKGVPKVSSTEIEQFVISG